MEKVQHGIDRLIYNKADIVAKFKNVPVNDGDDEYVAELILFQRFPVGRDVRSSKSNTENYFITVVRKGDIANNSYIAMNAVTVYEVSKEEGNAIYKQIRAERALTIE